MYNMLRVYHRPILFGPLCIFQNIIHGSITTTVSTVSWTDDRDIGSLCKSSRMQELNKSRRNGETWVQKDGENDNLSLTSVSLFKGK